MPTLGFPALFLVLCSSAPAWARDRLRLYPGCSQGLAGASGSVWAADCGTWSASVVEVPSSSEGSLTATIGALEPFRRTSGAEVGDLLLVVVAGQQATVIPWSVQDGLGQLAVTGRYIQFNPTPSKVRMVGCAAKVSDPMGTSRCDALFKDLVRHPRGPDLPLPESPDTVEVLGQRLPGSPGCGYQGDAAAGEIRCPAAPRALAWRRLDSLPSPADLAALRGVVLANLKQSLPVDWVQDTDPTCTVGGGEAMDCYRYTAAATTSHAALVAWTAVGRIQDQPVALRCVFPGDADTALPEPCSTFLSR